MWLDWAWAGGRAHWEREREEGVAEVESGEEDEEVDAVEATGQAASAPSQQQKRNKKRPAGTKRTVAQV